ncbi:hypothetical protein U1Q18_037589 [Sarracenia purpurea var. burkii]
MSRVGKWKLEKTKVKVVFRLQFHATHIPQAGWDKLFISFIPADSGKATAKTTKANVRNGTCKWADPIYETTRLLQGSTRKQYDDKLYKFVVAMGSSRSSVLGEASINLADYADALKPSIIALPLHGCDSGTILHVTVQLLTSKTGFREFEQQRELRERGLHTGTDLNRHGGFGTEKESSSVEFANGQTDKANARVRFRPDSNELPSVEEEVRLTEEYADSAAGFDGSSNTSESLNAEKHDTSSTHEIDSLKSTVSGDQNGLSHCQSPREQKGNSSDLQILAQGSSDWVHGWSSDYSVDNDLAIAYEENNRLRGSLEVAESSILELKFELSSLQSHADEIGIETQNVAQQLAAEIASGEQLAKEISFMKSECSKLKGNLEQLESLKLNPQFETRKTGNSNQNNLFRGLQGRWLKGILVMEDKIRELQSRLYLGLHDRDLRFLHSDLEAFLIFLQGLKQGTEEKSFLENLPSQIETVKEIESKQLVSGNGLDLDLYQPPDMLHCLSIPSIVSQEPDSMGASNALRSQIFELLRELDESKAERESVARKMDQMECYYEALVQELEENQKQMLGELQNLRNEHSTCLYTIATASAEMESMRQDMNEQILRFTEERRDLDSINRELERRAITSEAALRRARSNYSIAVDQLQKDLDLLSFQVLSMFETNENLIKQTFSENPEESATSELLQYQNQNAGVKKEIFCGDILLEDMKKSLLLQEGLYQKVEEELSEMHVANVYLDIFSKILRETLLEASAEKTELANLLKQGTLDKANLQNEILSLKEELKAIKSEKNELAYSKENLQKMAIFLEEKFGGLLASYHKQFNGLFSLPNSVHYDPGSRDIMNVVSQVEKIQLNAWEKILQLLEEKKNLEDERDLAQVSSTTANSEILAMKQKLKHDIKNMSTKLESFNVIVEKLQLQLETLANKLHISSRAEEKYANQNEELLADLALLEVELQQLTSQNINLAKEILGFDTVTEELGRSKLTIVELTQERQDLMMSLQDKTEESVKLVSELDSLKERLRLLQDELHAERSCRDNLEGTVTNLTFQLNEKHDELLRFSQHEAEKILQLLGEKKNLEDERDLAQASSTTANSEMMVVKQKFKHDIKCMATKLESSNVVIEKLQLELENLANKLHISSRAEEKYANQNEELLAEFALLEVELQQLTSQNINLAKEILGLESLDTVTEELGRSKLTIAELTQERQDLMMSLQDKTEESVELVSELDSLKERLRFLQDELNVERSCRDNLEAAVTNLTFQLNEKHDELLRFSQHEAEKILQLLEEKKNLEDERDLAQVSLSTANSEILAVKQKFKHDTKSMATKLESFNVVMENLQLDLENLAIELHASFEAEEKYKNQNEELLADLALLEVELQQLTSQNMNLAEEILGLDTVTEELGSSKLTIVELTRERQDLMMSLQDKTEESVKFVSELDSLKERLRFLQDELHVVRSSRDKLEGTITDLTFQLNEKHDHFKKLRKESSRLTDLEIELSEMHEYVVAADVKIIFIRTHYETQTEEHALRLQSSEEQRGELLKKLFDVEVMLNRSRTSEAHCTKENVNLLNTVDSLRSEHGALSDLTSIMTIQLEEYRKRVATMEANFAHDKNECNLEVEQLKHMLVVSEVEIDKLISSMEESVIIVIVLKDKLDELHAQVTSLEECNDDLMKLQNQCKDLTRRLSEQILRTEEFKNLSIHLKDLKDKAEAEWLQAREKREPEGPSVALQESLRIAFIKEQYETQVEELIQQLSVSRKHGEEVLRKLQDSVEELENRKKSEASHLKRNEELSLKILDLEAELQSVVSEKREKIKAYDCIKAELECALLSLECCREEKQMLENSLQECNEELRHIYRDTVLEKSYKENSVARTSSLENTALDTSENGLNGMPFFKCSDQNSMTNCEKVDSSPIPRVEGEQSTSPANNQPLQAVFVPESIHGISMPAFIEQGALLHSDSKHVAVVNDPFKTQSLKFSMDYLQKELERMKTENSEDHHFDPKFQGLQSELMQLHKANEELRSIFPLSNEFPDSGSALERVLALEIELAEVLQTKKKSSILFQSSFLKQHNDDQALFQSFKDINELIKEMLELKGRHAAMGSELKEMHNRYSQLSLQFAEVEGERQKLMMTLKNVRASRRFTHPSHSLSPTLGDHPS